MSKKTTGTSDQWYGSTEGIVEDHRKGIAHICSRCYTWLPARRMHSSPHRLREHHAPRPS
jgi:hypothetical protein